MLRSLFLAALCATVACTPPSRESAVLIPCPLEVVPGRETFDFSGGVTVGAADASLRPAADYLADALAAEGIGVRRAGADADVVLSLDPTLAPQAYRLAVARERIELRAASYEGAVSAAATLRQLLWAADGGRLHAVEIADAPRFAWRSTSSTGCIST